jgi:hypothetical protein
MLFEGLIFSSNFYPVRKKALTVRPLGLNRSCPLDLLEIKSLNGFRRDKNIIVRVGF